ncbi:MAG: cytochrome P450 [Snowella sp.]|nr:cytochrome P450 [Snowella sp.]
MSVSPPPSSFPNPCQSFESEPSEPVSVNPNEAATNSLTGWLQFRQNLLSCWSEATYSLTSFEFSLLRQHYFVCNSPDTVRRVFLEEHDNYDRKSPQMRHALEPLLGDGLFVSDGQLWRERREYCTPAFESDLLPDFAAMMVESAQELAENWRSLPLDAPVDILNEMAKLTARIIGRTIFGDDIAESEASQVVQGFSNYQRHIEHIQIADAFGLSFLNWMTNPFRRIASLKSAYQVHEVIDRIIDRYSQQKKNELSNLQESSRLTLLSLLLEGHTGKADSPKKCPLGFSAARNEAIVMFMAGHETTANALAWTWYLLDHSPLVAAKLREELDQVIGKRPPKYEDVVNLPYTRSVFEEAMRLYPPVPVLSRQARENDCLDDITIHPNTIILVIPWLLHRHRLYWEKPNSFIPERFLNPSSRPDNFVYIPFSAGRRACLGKRFGMMEGILCLATLAQRFQPRLIPQHRVSIECRITLRPEGGLPMYLNPLE